MKSEKKKKTRWYQSIKTKIIVVILVLIVFALEIIGANFISQLEDELLNNHISVRQTQVEFIETSSQPFLSMLKKRKSDTDLEPYAEIESLLREFSGDGNVLVEVISSDLSIIGTSSRVNQNLVGSRSDDVDVRRTLLTNESISYEYMDEQSGDLRWKVVEPIESTSDPDQIIGVVLLESNIEEVYEQVANISEVFIRSSLIAIVITILLAYALSREIVTPIIAIQESTQKIANGDYSVNLVNDNNDEIGELSDSINELALRVSNAQEQIDQERRRLDRVLTHMSDGVIATDRVGRVTVINHAARDILSIPETYAEGKNVLDLLGLGEDVTMSDLYKETGEDQMIEIGERFIRLNFSTIESEMGFIQGVVCVLHDATEAENIEQDRKAFVSNVSHELRTPLTSMRSYVEALKDGAWKDEKIAPQFLTVIENETDRMIRMVSDLLQLSRMDAGSANLEFEMVDLRALFAFVLDRFDMLIQSEHDEKFTIKRELTDESIWIEADQDRLAQVLDNIMNNAIKYSPDGGTITATLTRRDGDALISISDEGIGIPKADLPRIFSRFYRVDKARSRAMGGTGLGLAISKEVVDQHDGKIWVRSYLNEGTTFYISLPTMDLDFDEGEAWDE